MLIFGTSANLRLTDESAEFLFVVLIHLADGIYLRLALLGVLKDADIGVSIELHHSRLLDEAFHKADDSAQLAFKVVESALNFFSSSEKHIREILNG